MNEKCLIVCYNPHCLHPKIKIKIKTWKCAYGKNNTSYNLCMINNTILSQCLVCYVGEKNPKLMCYITVYESIMLFKQHIKIHWLKKLSNCFVWFHSMFKASYSNNLRFIFLTRTTITISSQRTACLIFSNLLGTCINSKHESYWKINNKSNGF